jgi:hypothetical protein
LPVAIGGSWNPRVPAGKVESAGTLVVYSSNLLVPTLCSTPAEAVQAVGCSVFLLLCTDELPDGS